MLEPEVREDRGLINVYGDLFDAALGSDVLSARERRAPTDARKADEVVGYHRHGAPRALLPRRIGSRVDDDLTDDSPARVVRIAARNEKPCERMCHSHRLRLRSMAVEMPQSRPDLTAVLDRPGELARGRARLAGFVVDPSTVLAGIFGHAFAAAPLVKLRASSSALGARAPSSRSNPSALSPPRARGRRYHRRQTLRRERHGVAHARLLQPRNQIVDITEPPASLSIEVLIPKLTQLAIGAHALHRQDCMPDLGAVRLMSVPVHPAACMIR